MTETLTNIEICELLKWYPAETYMDCEWLLPDGTGINTPAFDELEQPWFEYIVPYLYDHKINYSISSCNGESGSNVQLQDTHFTPILSTMDKQLHTAFNKALFQLREQL